jgi:hypothetical protein
MKPFWEKAVKHADAYTPGIADVSAWIRGAGNIWVENKAIAHWPRYPDTPVTLGLEDLQRAFLIARRGFLFARVGRTYLLWDHLWLDRIDTHHATRRRVERVAVRIWNNKVIWKEFAECVRKRYA